MPTWSTDTLPEADRFPFWREVRAKHVFGLSAELDAPRRASFRGVFTAEPVATATLIEQHASSYLVRRTPADIARAPGNSLCIYKQISGGAWFGTAGRGEFVISAGAVSINHSEMPFETHPITDEGFHLRILKIPFGICVPFLRRERDLSPQPVKDDGRLHTLLSLYFSAFLRRVPQLSEAEAETAVLSLAQIALAVRGMLSSYDEPLRSAVRAGRLMCAQEMIAQHSHRTDLSPAMVAAMLGISVRQLHLLFESTGTSFARNLMSKRLDDARGLLTQGVASPVSAIAFSCGFDSLATFYRAFRGSYGFSPRDYRQSLAAVK